MLYINARFMPKQISLFLTVSLILMFNKYIIFNTLILYFLFYFFYKGLIKGSCPFDSQMIQLT